MVAAVLRAVVRSEQFVRNEVDSGTRSGYAARGRRSGRSGLLEYRFALPPELRPSLLFPRSRNNNVLQTTCRMHHNSIRRPQRHGKPALTSCCICRSGLTADAGAPDRQDPR